MKPKHLFVYLSLIIFMTAVSACNPHGPEETGVSSDHSEKPGPKESEETEAFTGIGYLFSAYKTNTAEKGQKNTENECLFVIANDNESILQKGTVVIIQTELMDSEMKELLESIPSGEIVRLYFNRIAASDPPSIQPLRIEKSKETVELEKEKALAAIKAYGYEISSVLDN